MRTYFFLFHQFCVGTIIYNIFTEDWRCERAVYFLGIQVLVLPVQNEVISFYAQADGSLFPQQDEGKNITILYQH